MASKHPAYALKGIKKHLGSEGPGYLASLVRVSDEQVLAHVQDAGDGGALRIRLVNAAGYAEFSAYVESGGSLGGSSGGA